MTTEAATALPENLTNPSTGYVDLLNTSAVTGPSISPAYLETIFSLPARPSRADDQMLSHGDTTPDTTPFPSPSQSDILMPSLGARLWATFAPLEHRTVGKLYVTSRAAKEDVRTAERKAVIAAAGLGYLAIKAAGKIKLPSWAVSIGTMDVLTATHSPLAATAAAFTMSAAWSLTAAAGVDNAINHYSGTVGTVGGHFPKATKSVAETLPGLNHTSERNQNGENTYKWLGRTALTRLQRGLVASNHLTRYVMMAGISGQPKEQRRHFRRALSVDAAAISAGMYGLVSETIMAIEPHDPDLATNIQEAVKNPLVLSAVSGLILAGNVIRNVFRHRKAKKPHKAVDSASLKS